MSSNQLFILELLKEAKPYLAMVLPAFLTFLTGLHMKQPNYMVKNVDGNQPDSK